MYEIVLGKVTRFLVARGQEDLARVKDLVDHGVDPAQQPGQGRLHCADGGCHAWPGGGGRLPSRPFRHQHRGEG